MFHIIAYTISLIFHIPFRVRFTIRIMVGSTWQIRRSPFQGLMKARELVEKEFHNRHTSLSISCLWLSLLGFLFVIGDYTDSNPLT